MTEAAKVESFAVQRRREGRREEARTQTELTALLAEHLDPACTFWTSLENKPRSPVSAIFQRARGVKSGLADVVIIQQQPERLLIVFLELKAPRGVASKAQKQVRAEILPAGAKWWLVRSARAAMMALHLSGVVFRHQWTPPELEPWEGPFADPHQRLPQEPTVAAKRRATMRAWRERQKAARIAAAEAAA
jgi:hypothetical protein